MPAGGAPPSGKDPKGPKDAKDGGAGVPGGDPGDDKKKGRRFGFDKTQVRAIIERHFRIYEERDALPGLDQSVLVAFFIMADQAQLDAAYPTLQKELRALDPFLMPVLRQEGGETVVVVTRRSDVQPPARRLPRFLLVATFVTLTLAGSSAWLSFEGSIDIIAMLEPRLLAKGFLSFAVPFAFYFGAQELARRWMARRHGVMMATSFLVPVPPFVFIPAIGTFGGILHARAPLPDRKALFDIAAAGPVAGFLATIPVLVVGLMLTASSAVPVPDGGDVQLEIIAPDGTAWAEGEGGLIDPFERSRPKDAFRAHNVTVTFAIDTAGRGYGSDGWQVAAHGEGTTGEPVDLRLNMTATDESGALVQWAEESGSILPGQTYPWAFDLNASAWRLAVVLEFHVPDRTTVPIGVPLSYSAVAALFDDNPYILHPVGFAAWSMLLVTAITLVPAGRLDGGAVARALFGSRMAIAAYVSMGSIAVLSFFYPSWVYLVLFVLLFLGARHPAPLNESTPLGRGRWIVAALLLLLFIATFVPIPAVLPDRV